MSQKAYMTQTKQKQKNRIRITENNLPNRSIGIAPLNTQNLSPYDHMTFLPNVRHKGFTYDTFTVFETFLRVREIASMSHFSCFPCYCPVNSTFSDATE